MTAPDRTAFTFAQSVVQQILTLATGISTLTITFFHEFAEHPTVVAKVTLVMSWGAFALSILAGIAALMTITGNLEKQPDPKIYSDNTRVLAGAQIVLFAIGVPLTVVAGALAI